MSNITLCLIATFLVIGLVQHSELSMAETIPSNSVSVPAQVEYYFTRSNCNGQNPQFISDFDFHQMVLKWKALGEADYTCACPQTIEILWENAPNFAFVAHCTDRSATYGPYSGTFFQRSACQSGDLVGNNCKTYSCPATGTWTLSSDKQTCTGCWDTSQVLDQNNACVNSKDKDAGPHCEVSSDNNNPFSGSQ